MPDSDLKDHAILVGVNHYKHESLSELKGAVGDTIDFLKWLLSDNGGNVPPENISWFCSPIPDKQELPLELHFLEIQPAERAKILDSIGELVMLGDKNDGEPIGRRLYLHFSGHGVAKGRSERCFLAGDHSSANDRYLVASSVADVFIESAIFKEVLLFMDCCQVYTSRIKDIPLDVNYTVDADASLSVKNMVSYASQFGKATREKEMPEGKIRGLLSKSVLDGLRGGAAEGNIITAMGLKGFIEDRFVQLRDPKSKDVPDIPTPDPDFTISKGVTPIKFTVEVEIRLHGPEKKFIVIDGSNLEPVEVDPIDLSDNVKKINLIPGKRYQFGIPVDDDYYNLKRSKIKDIVEGGDNIVEL